MSSSEDCAAGTATSTLRPLVSSELSKTRLELGPKERDRNRDRDMVKRKGERGERERERGGTGEGERRREK